MASLEAHPAGASPSKSAIDNRSAKSRLNTGNGKISLEQCVKETIMIPRWTRDREQLSHRLRCIGWFERPMQRKPATIGSRIDKRTHDGFVLRSKERTGDVKQSTTRGQQGP